MSEAHQQCVDAGSHICAAESGRVCATEGCSEPAGTWWGPHWCPEHDKERLDRISGQLNDIMATMEEQGNGPVRR